MCLTAIHTHTVLQQSVLHSLLRLDMFAFVAELGNADLSLMNKLWPSDINQNNERFTVFGVYDEELDKMRNLLSTSALSQTVLGHIVEGTIYSSMLTHGSILTPLNAGNVTIHVTSIAHSPTKVRSTKY